MIMISIRYEEYYNDFKRKNYEKRFKDLEELEEWIFGQMRQDYSKELYIMYFPRKEASSIDFIPFCGGPSIFIHQIENEEGILLSDGEFTSGQKHMSHKIKEWCEHCEERRKAPKFKFVE